MQRRSQDSALDQPTHARSAAAPRTRIKIAALLNANARDVSLRTAEKVQRLLPEARVLLSRSREHGEALVDEIIEGGYDPILSGGGDGSAMALINMLRAAPAHRCGRPLPRIGLLKLGTGNGWAGAMGARELETTLFRLREDVARGRLPTERFDLVEVEGRLGHFAGVGWDGRILNDFNDQWRDKKGIELALRKSLGGYLFALVTRTVPKESWAYLTKGRCEVEVRVLSGEAYAIDAHGRQTRLDVRREPVIYRGTATVTGCATTEHFGFGFRAHPYARARERFMSLRVLNLGVAEGLVKIPRLWAGTLTDPRSDRHFLVQHARMDFSRPMPFQIGGDAHGERRSIEYRVAEETVDLLSFRAPR
jgi:diacylglycerol kinase family enzyme